MLMIELIDDRLDDPLEIPIVNQESRFRINLTVHFHYYAVSMPVKPVAGMLRRKLIEPV